MPDANQYAFKHQELLGLLIKAAGIHEGRWRLAVNFGFAAGNFGPSDQEMSPGAVVALNWVGIVKVESGETPPVSLAVDAGEVNPAAT